MAKQHFDHCFFQFCLLAAVFFLPFVAAFSGVRSRSATCMFRHIMFWPSVFLVGIISINLLCGFLRNTRSIRLLRLTFAHRCLFEAGNIPQVRCCSCCVCTQVCTEPCVCGFLRSCFRSAAFIVPGGFLRSLHSIHQYLFSFVHDSLTRQFLLVASAHVSHRLA